MTENLPITLDTPSEDVMNLTKMNLYLGGGYVTYDIYYLTPDAATLEKILSLKALEKLDDGQDEFFAREKEFGLKRQDGLDPKTGKIVPAYAWAGGGGAVYSHYTNGGPSLVYGMAHSYAYYMEGEFSAYGLPDENGKTTRLEKSQEDIFRQRLEFYQNREESLTKFANVKVLSFSPKALIAEKDAFNSPRPE